MKKIVISGYYGFDNAGDELVLREIIRQVKGSSSFDLMVLSADPETTAKKYEVQVVNRWGFFSVIRAIRETDLLISGGGSLLQDATSKNGILYYLGIIFLGQLFGKKVVILSQGIGPITHNRNRNLVRRVLNKVSYLSVRDRESKKYLEDIGVSKDIVVSADPVFLLEAEENRQEALWQELRLDPDKKLIVVALRQWDNIEEVMKAVQTFISTFPDKEYQVRYLPMHHPQDADFLKEYVEADVTIQRKLDEMEIVALIASSELVVGMRLHALIIAAAQKKNFLAISYDPKVKVLDQECYGHHLLIDTDHCHADLLQRKYEIIKKQTVSLSDIQQRASLPFLFLDTLD